MPQTKAQRRVESILDDAATKIAKERGVTRREVLFGGAGILLGLMALNQVFGPFFRVEKRDLERRFNGETLSHRGQFIFDIQTHMIRDDFSHRSLVRFARWAGLSGSNPRYRDKKIDMSLFRLRNFVREVFVDSETDRAILSGAPFASGNCHPNEDLFAAVDAMNSVAGQRVADGYYLLNPLELDWMARCERDLLVMKPIGWKVFPMGEPMSPRGNSWRLDDRTIAYPFYEFASKKGIRNICIHKGLVPASYEFEYPAHWRAAQVDDLEQAAKDWPHLNFIIFHSALRPFAGDSPEFEMNEFNRTGRIRWTSDLVEISNRLAAGNVYAEIGSSFASTAVTYPEFSTAFLGLLLNEMGDQKILWGTDSVWYGSPQWQIDAFRTIEISEEMLGRKGWSRNLGEPGSATRNMIFGGNAARLFGLGGDEVRKRTVAFSSEAIEKANHVSRERSSFYYGYAGG